MNKLVEQVKEDLLEELQQKNAVIETSNLCDLNIIPFQFRQLIANLIGNSLKFAKENQPPRIKISSSIEDGESLTLNNIDKELTYCHLRVSDNGIGFDPQYRDRIFEVFQRLNANTLYVGTGIGLAIVKTIVENHHGAIEATGEIDKGATFDIYIPI